MAEDFTEDEKKLEQAIKEAIRRREINETRLFASRVIKGVIGIIGIVVGILLVDASAIIDTLKRGGSSWVAIATAVLFAFTALLRYLNRSSNYISTGTDSELRQVQYTLAHLKNSVEQVERTRFGGSKDELVRELLPLVKDDLDTRIVQNLKSRFVDSMNDASRNIEIRTIFSRAEERLQRELNSLGRRANLNLTIGVITTGIAISLLVYMVLGITVRFDDITEVLGYYVPRVTVAIFVEIFAFFFLRLYRANLAEIRAYQQDMTVLSLNAVGLEAAWACSDDSAKHVVAKEFVTQPKKLIPDAPENKGLGIDAKLVTELLESFSKVVAHGKKG